MASHANPEARIHALEPVERTYWRLADNLRANRLARKIEPHRLAASDEGGQAEIHVFRGPGVLDAGASLVSKESGVVRTQLVQTIRLDTFVRDNDILRVDLIKIDVERHELAVIEGMAELVSRHKPAILVEVFSREELVEIIGMLPGYRFAVINERAQKAYVGDEAAHETAGQNVLFAPWSLERLRTFFDAIAPL